MNHSEIWAANKSACSGAPELGVLGHTCLYEGVGPMNYARYMAGTLVKSTLKLTRIH